MKSNILILEVNLVEPKRKLKKYHVVISGPSEYEKEYVLLEDTIIKHMVFKDKEFTCEEFDEILASEASFNALNSALNFISYQLRSEKEVINHLKKKEIKSENLKKVVEKLKSLGYIDDEKYSKSLIEYYYKKLKGPNYIKRVLMEKEVKSSIIDNSLLNYTYEMEKGVASEIIQKELTKLYNQPINKQKQKLQYKLISSGFSIGVINEVIKSTKFKEDVSQTLNKDLEKLMKKHDYKTDRNTLNKITASLISKGYSYSQVKEVISNIDA